MSTRSTATRRTSALTIAALVLAPATWGAVIACSNDPNAPATEPATANDEAGSAQSDASAPNAPDGGGGPTTLDTPVSGSRIEMYFYQTADGLRWYSGKIRDAVLDVDCSVGKYEDGLLRCMPAGMTVAVNEDPSLVGADCTTELGAVARGCAASFAIALHPDGKQCLTANVAYRADGDASAPYGLVADGGCEPKTATGTDTFHAFGTKIAASELVAFHVEEISLSDRFSVAMLVGEDGSRDPVAWLDRARHQRCTVKTLVDGKPHCAPNGLYGLRFTDDACSMRAGVSYGECADTGLPSFNDPAVVSSFEGTAPCGPFAARLFAAGAPLTKQSYFAINAADGGCFGPNTSSDNALVSVGQEIPPATFPEVATQRRGAGRLRVDENVAMGVTFGVTSVFDTQLDTTCDVETAADGALRCIPTGIYDVAASPRLFTDAACTQRVLGAAATCDVPRFARRYDGDGACGKYAVRAYPAGPALPSVSALYMQPAQGGACTPTSPQPGLVYYPIGQEIDPSTLPAVDLVAR